MTLYEKIANEIRDLIRAGVIKSTDKLPSVRKGSKMFNVSPATIQQAYYLLETQGIIYAKERSGFYINPAFAKLSTGNSIAKSKVLAKETEVEVSDFIFSVLAAHKDNTNIPFGSAFPSPELYPIKHLTESMAKALHSLEATPYELVTDMAGGCSELKRQIELRYLLNGLKIHEDEIVITSGAMEALSLSLQAVTKPGDLVAVESPCFYAILQILERLQLKAIEIPVDDIVGLDIDYFAEMVEQFEIKALVLMTKFHNPTGSSIPADNLKKLYQIIKKHQIPAIVDDVYSEIYYGQKLPHYLKSLDKEDLVLHCDSFCKSLAPGFRVGWVSAGRYATQVDRLKLMTTISPSVPSQLAISHYLTHRHYDRHLTRLRAELQRSQKKMLSAIGQYFPKAIHVEIPDGGYFLWIGLPKSVDAIGLYKRALAHKISIAPGPIFSASQQFNHHIRLNYGMKWHSELDQAMEKLGILIAEMMQEVR